LGVYEEVIRDETGVTCGDVGNGLFAVTGDGRTQEIANQPVRGLAPDGRGAALAIVGGHSLRRRAPNGEWVTVGTSELELSCCTAVGDAIYVGTDDVLFKAAVAAARSGRRGCLSIWRAATG
jgi:hypothetical protein